MVNLGDQGDNLPTDGGAPGAHGAPIANPPATQTTHQESGGPSSSITNHVRIHRFHGVL